MPDSPALPHYAEGVEHFKKGSWEPAIECFKKATEADKDFYRGWAYLGMAFAGAGKIDEAIEAYRECIDIAPTYHKALNNVGELYLRKGLLDYASMVFKMATEAAPENTHYFYNLGITYSEIGMRKQAEEALAAGWQLDPCDFECASELAQVQFTLKKYAAAAQTLESFLELNPDFRRGPELRARVTMLKRKIEQDGPGEPAGQNDPPAPNC